jgi:hypothetical protein
MSNERRGCPRIPTTLDAAINVQKFLYSCKIRNISLSGAYVLINTPELSLDCTVELAITSYHASNGNTQQLSATVERLTNDGAGIKFNNLEIEAYFTLVDIVYMT